MRPRWDFGDPVRVTRNVRNDGTFPGAETGDLLVRRGSIGHVCDVGTFLQDQIIYSVHFLDEDRVVGCREEELLDVNEAWIESRFEVRQKVQATRTLAVRGKLIVIGSRGEILNVERESGPPLLYHVHFDCLPGKPLRVPETCLDELKGN
ncbi:MAG: nitrogen fixation protein NifZ [Georgfuchsia sp.]